MKVVIRPIIQPVPSEVDITISYETAQTLVDIFRRIGGSVDSSRRGPVQKLSEALSKAGVSATAGLDIPGNYSFNFTDIR